MKIGFASLKAKIAAGGGTGAAVAVALAGLTGTTGTPEQSVVYVGSVAVLGGFVSGYLYVLRRIGRGKDKDADARRKWESFDEDQQRTLIKIVEALESK
jgi:hypothetical protein